MSSVRTGARVIELVAATGNDTHRVQQPSLTVQ